MESSTSAARFVGLTLLAVVAVNIIRRIIQRHKGYPFPPGPTPFPIVGSALSVNTEQPWLTYTEWRAKYGDIIYLRLFDSDWVVLNSTSVTIDLLEKRSSIYSDRPFIATRDPYGNDCNLGFAQYSDQWRLCRRIFHQTFRADSAFDFRPTQVRKAQQMVINLIDDPTEYPSHFATFSAAIAMSTVYDYEASAQNDPLVSMMDNFLRIAIPALVSWKALVLKAFPFLLHVPDWFPGSFIKLEAEQAYALRLKVVDEPYQYAQEHMQSVDPANVCMVADHIARMDHLDHSYRPTYEKALKHAAASAFMGSVETTSSTLMSFMLAMVENPHVWKRAQAEIDSSVGTDRLPDFDDRSSLPYVEAILRETLRWIPVAPLGIPHAVIRDDVYKNYHIPSGATVAANIWAMSRDETRYPEPEKFMPERFLDAAGTLTEDNPAEFVFGFGRRVCAGRYAADAAVWSAIVTMLATLDFNRAKDANGQDVLFTVSFASSVTLHPKPFPCRITPRPHVSKELLARVRAG